MRIIKVQLGWKEAYVKVDDSVAKDDETEIKRMMVNSMCQEDTFIHPNLTYFIKKSFSRG